MAPSAPAAPPWPPVWLFAANLIGYARVALGVAAFAFAFAPRGDAASRDFFEDRHNFKEFGFVPDFRGSGRAYSLWAQPFHNGALAEYAKAAGDDLPNLAAGTALVRVRHTPKWLVELGLQFGLPVLIVILLFGVSYLLVWLGPLKGISTKYMNTPPGGGPGQDL